MTAEIIPIRVPMPLNVSSVNCYLIAGYSGFVLVDTGMPSSRAFLEQELLRLGCRPGNLRLIIITHGDFDHTGSAAYLRQKFDTKIAMHPGDAGMAEQADMFFNRRKGSRLLKSVVPALFGFTKKARFSADIPVSDGFDLSEYGLDACLLNLPGHSTGSIAVWMSSTGDLICGDLLMNERNQPSLGFGDPAPFMPSLRRIKDMPIRTIYPGHGKPFQANPALWDALIR